MFWVQSCRMSAESTFIFVCSLFSFPAGISPQLVNLFSLSVYILHPLGVLVPTARVGEQKHAMDASRSLCLRWTARYFSIYKTSIMREETFQAHTTQSINYFDAPFGTPFDCMARSPPHAHASSAPQ